VHVAVVGKGGAGKSVVAGTLARVLARRGRRVLALDSDMLPGLTLSLGAEAPAAPPLLDAAERDEDGRWRLKRGIGPVRAVQRYATQAPDGIRLLQAGKVGPDGLPPIMPALQAYYKVVHRLARSSAFAEWDVIGDLPGGPRQAAFDWAPYARTFVLVVEPTSQSLLAAPDRPRRLAAGGAGHGHGRGEQGAPHRRGRPHRVLPRGVGRRDRAGGRRGRGRGAPRRGAARRHARVACGRRHRGARRPARAEYASGMKLVVAGKGGVGKTTVSGTLARLLARNGDDVLALDADANPMLGVSLGVGMERTDLLVAVRQAVDAGEAEHQPTVAGMVESFGTDAPDGVRLVVASRIDPGCP